MNTLLHTHQFNKLFCTYNVKQSGTTVNPQSICGPQCSQSISFKTKALVADYYMHDPSIRLYSLELEGFKSLGTVGFSAIIKMISKIYCSRTGDLNLLHRDSYHFLLHSTITSIKELTLPPLPSIRR
jgi:hypothetical protein